MNLASTGAIGRLLQSAADLVALFVDRGDRRPHGGEDPTGANKPAAVALITYATSEDAMRRALAAIEQDGVLAEKPQVIRIEKS